MAEPTVIIASKDFECGYLIINEKDYDPETMKLYEPKKEKAENKSQDESEKTDGLRGGSKESK